MADGISVGKTLLKNEVLQKYILNTSTYPREHKLLKKIREVTFQKYGKRAEMCVPPDEGLLLSMLLKLMNAKKALEIGVFTGYSLLVTTLALPHDGQIVAIDPNREAYEVGLPFIQEAGVEHKINYIQSDAIAALNEILNNGEQHNTFDFVFVDADKTNYHRYHELVLKLVKIGGVVAYDNTLWYGSVAINEAEIEDMSGIGLDSFTADQKAIVNLNNSLASDPRIEISQIPIGDGLTLCRRII